MLLKTRFSCEFSYFSDQKGGRPWPDGPPPKYAPGSKSTEYIRIIASWRLASLLNNAGCQLCVDVRVVKLLEYSSQLLGNFLWLMGSTGYNWDDYLFDCKHWVN